MRVKQLLISTTCALLFFPACGPARDPDRDPAVIARGQEIYTFEGCSGCHGAQRQGSKAAPRLDRLGRHWNEGELVRYLADPAGYPKDGRLKRLEDSYPATMAGLPAAEEERLRTLASFLLSR